MDAPSQYRRECLNEHGEQCEICDSQEDIIAHHIDGNRSHNSLDNLVPVCRSCHARIHGGSIGYEEWTDKLEENTGQPVSLTMYLPDDLVSDLDLTFQEIRLEHQRKYGRKIQKNADYWPAIIEASHCNKTVRDVLAAWETTE